MQVMFKGSFGRPTASPQNSVKVLRVVEKPTGPRATQALRSDAKITFRSVDTKMCKQTIPPCSKNIGTAIEKKLALAYNRKCDQGNVQCLDR